MDLIFCSNKNGSDDKTIEIYSNGTVTVIAVGNDIAIINISWRGFNLDEVLNSPRGQWLIGFNNNNSARTFILEKW